MHDLKPITALGTDIPRVENIGDMQLQEVCDLAFASVAARKGQPCTAALKAHLGLTPPKAGKMVANDTYSMIWMAPDQWLISAPHDAHETLADEIKKALSQPASVTEQNDAWARFDISGAHVVDALERLCPLPVRTARKGFASRSMVEHIGCFVACNRAGRDFSILGPRSFAPSLYHALSTAMRSVAD